MTVHRSQLSVTTKGPGLYLITPEIQAVVKDAPAEGPGVLHVFVKHTSASLVIQENTSPSARFDLEEFMDRVVPEEQSWHRHVDEGPDDTVAHMKSSITPTALSVPTDGSRLVLGTWQGLYLWEHRKGTHQREIVLTLIN